MRKVFFIFFSALTFLHNQSVGQYDDNAIHTKEGRSILNRRSLITNCLKSLNKDRSDQTALAVCECQTDKFDRKFTNKQYRKYTHGGIVDLNGLIKEDSLLEMEIQKCYIGSGKTLLLQAEGFKEGFISGCMRNIQKNSEKKLDSNRLKSFCSCEQNLIMTKKLSDADIDAINNPNSLLFYEIMYKCGNPNSDKDISEKNWSEEFVKDVAGPESDTLHILNLSGMTYVKVKTGSLVQIWLFDTGSSDLLINKDMEDIMRKENIISESNFLGVGEYEMANGSVDSCRRYKINNVRIGKFTVNNIVVAVTEKGKKIIVGKGLLNKFKTWILDNKENVLILNK